VYISTNSVLLSSLNLLYNGFNSSKEESLTPLLIINFSIFFESHYSLEMNFEKDLITYKRKK
jgi:hypothetical protein